MRCLSCWSLFRSKQPYVRVHMCVCRSGSTVATTPAATSPFTAMRRSSRTTSAPSSASEIRRLSGLGPDTWASSAGPSWRTPVEVRTDEGVTPFCCILGLNIQSRMSPWWRAAAVAHTSVDCVCRTTWRSVRGRGPGGSHGAERDAIPSHRHRDLRHQDAQKHHRVVRHLDTCWHTTHRLSIPVSHQLSLSLPVPIQLSSFHSVPSICSSFVTVFTPVCPSPLFSLPPCPLHPLRFSFPFNLSCLHCPMAVSLLPLSLLSVHSLILSLPSPLSPSTLLSALVCFCPCPPSFSSSLFSHKPVRCWQEIPFLLFPLVRCSPGPTCWWWWWSWTAQSRRPWTWSPWLLTWFWRNTIWS